MIQERRLCPAKPTMPAPIAFVTALPELLQAWSPRYGAGSLAALTAALCEPTRLCEPDRLLEPDEWRVQANEAERRHLSRYGERAVSAEKTDELARDAARTSGNALVAYQSHWDTRLRRMARRHPERFYAPGLSAEEVRDTLTLELVHALRSPERDAEFTLPGKEWGLLVVSAELGALRRRFRLEAESVDFRTLTLPRSEPTQEDRWLEREEEVCFEESTKAAVQRLTASERQWFAALRLAARQGQFFEASDRLNLSAASRVLGKDRSSAHRAYREIQIHFQAELRRRQ